jgi:hypothetical protein
MKTVVKRVTQCGAVLGLAFCVALHADNTSFVGPLKNIKSKTSTVPANGDLNPYGVAIVPANVGELKAGDVLLSNFNNSMNQQGRGSTIVRTSAGDGTTKLFAQIDANKLPGPCPGGVGLTTALVVLRSGWVIVGSLPTPTGSFGVTSEPGCLIVLDCSGNVVETISGGDINGPWDMTALDLGTSAILFVTNVLNGTVAASPNPAMPKTVNEGTVLRIGLSTPAVGSGIPVEDIPRMVIASGFGERVDQAALVIGPTGLGLSSDGTLYVADTLGNRIAAVPDAAMTMTNLGGGGNTVSIGGALKAPLGLGVAPNGNVVTVNGNDGNMVETTPGGIQVAVKAVDVTDTPGGGTLFGLAISGDRDSIYFVNDGNNTLDLLHK